jgi:hypothetical protein
MLVKPGDVGPDPAFGGWLYATITGHSLKTVHRILERYRARTRGLAEQAIFNFENSPRTKFANQLQTSTNVVRAIKTKDEG